MATFSFQLSKETLQASIDALERHGKYAVVQISIDLVPDGIGYGAFNPRMDIVEEESQEQEDTQEMSVPQAFYDAFEGEGKQ